MEALILTCGTGGGHNTAAQAVEEELTRRGHHAVILGPYTLIGERAARRVGGAYIALVQRTPRLFGLVYAMGNLYRRRFRGVHRYIGSTASWRTAWPNIFGSIRQMW